MKLANYTWSSPLALAPMAGITDPPFRRICHQLGAGYSVSEMVAGDEHLAKSPKSHYRSQLDINLPPALQLLGNNPEVLAQASLGFQAKGFRVIDFNLGCPAKKVCKKAAGSALMGDIPQLKQIFKALAKAKQTGNALTLKMRTGLTTNTKNALEIASLAAEEGFDAITIHGRTRDDKFMGEAEYETIKHLANHLDIPIIANGDIRTAEQAEILLNETNIQGVMIGRAARGNPWLFQQINHYLTTGHITASPTPVEVLTLIRTQLEDMHQFYPEITAVRMARKHLNWYTGLLQLTQKSTLLDMFNQLETPQSQLEWIDELLVTKM